MMSSQQWFQAIDDGLHLGLEIAVNTTDLVPSYLAQLLNYQQLHKKRKLSLTFKCADLMPRLAATIIEPTLPNILSLKLNRHVITMLLSDTVNKTRVTTDGNTLGSNRVVDNDHYLRQPFTKSSVHRELTSVLAAVADVKYQLYLSYKVYLDKVASFDATVRHLNYSQADLEQNYWLAFEKAIVLFNVDSGTFKSYLDLWVKKMRIEGNHILGKALDAPSTAGVNVLGQSDECLVNWESGSNTLDTVNKQQQYKRILELARLVDPNGYAIQSLGLGDFDGA